MKFHDMLIDTTRRDKVWAVDMHAYLTAHPELHEIIDLYAQLGTEVPTHTTMLATLAWVMEALHIHGAPIDSYTFPTMTVEDEDDDET